MGSALPSLGRSKVLDKCPVFTDGSTTNQLQLLLISNKARLFTAEHFRSPFGHQYTRLFVLDIDRLEGNLIPLLAASGVPEMVRSPVVDNVVGHKFPGDLGRYRVFALAIPLYRFLEKRDLSISDMVVSMGMGRKTRRETDLTES